MGTKKPNYTGTAVGGLVSSLGSYSMSISAITPALGKFSGAAALYTGYETNIHPEQLQVGDLVVTDYNEDLGSTDDVFVVTAMEETGTYGSGWRVKVKADPMTQGIGGWEDAAYFHPAPVRTLKAYQRRLRKVRRFADKMLDGFSAKIVKARLLNYPDPWKDEDE